MCGGVEEASKLVCAKGDRSVVVWGGYMWFGLEYMWFGDNSSCSLDSGTQKICGD